MNESKCNNSAEKGTVYLVNDCSPFFHNRVKFRANECLCLKVVYFKVAALYQPVLLTRNAKKFH